MRVKPVFLLYLFATLVGVGEAAGGNWEQWRDPKSSARGNCPDCGPGEAKAESTVRVPHGVYVDIDNPPCGNAAFNSVELPDNIKVAAAAAFYEQAGPAANYAIELGESGINALLQAGANNPGTIGQLTRAWTNQPQVANCTRLVVVIPKNADITRIEKSDTCPGWCAWVGEPAASEVDNDLFAVSTVIKNWSHDSDRSATLRVYYQRN